MDLVFCGTPQFAVPTLRVLAEKGHRIHLVVTQPDRPSGRGMELSLPPVKQLALQLGMPIMQPERIKNNAEFRARLEEIRPEAIIVVGYGRIIPQWMIDLPLLGNLNLHASLLPKYRGAAPIQWAIANGEKITGVTTMRIDAGLDTGDILLQQEIVILPEDTSLTLGPKLSEIGAELMAQTLDGLRGRANQPAQTGRAARELCADPEERRWSHRLPAKSPRCLEPHARISAMAGCLHHLPGKEAERDRCTTISRR